MSKVKSRSTVGIFDVIRQNPLPLLLIGLVILTVISLLLVALIINMRRINHLVSKEKSHYQILSETDGLTGIYNHATFRNRAMEYLAKKFPSPTPSGTLIILDVDHFKNINDTLGHPQGDIVLRGVAGALTSVFSEEDFVGRLGGDEFAVLMKRTADTEAVIARCTELAKRSYFLCNQISVTLSIGAVTFTKGENFEELFRQADAALYETKKNGRNGYRIYPFDSSAADKR